MPKVFVEGADHYIVRMFKENGWEVAKKLEEANLVCFQGGADVSPELYGERNVGSYSDADTDWRSLVLYNNAKRLGIPMVGICRGGQFLNVMAGGKMIQDHPGHAIRGTHEIVLDEAWSDKTISYQVTSTHHQVMVVNPHASDLLGWATGKQHEVEIVHHWKENSLSFQPHPEYVEADHECQKLFFTLLGDLLSM